LADRFAFDDDVDVYHNYIVDRVCQYFVYKRVKWPIYCCVYLAGGGLFEPPAVADVIN